MFKNIRIGTKILIIMLLTSLSALLIVFTISYTEMLNLTQYSQSANIQLGTASSAKSEEALLNQAEQYLIKIAGEQAANVNAILSQIEDEVLITRDYTDRIYAHPQNFEGIMVPLPDRTIKGVPSQKYTLAPGVNFNPSLEKEIKLLSNLEYLLAPLIKNNTHLSNIYVGTENGISYRYSTMNTFNTKYDPRTRDWYKKAMQNKGKITWLDTYLDISGFNVVTVSIAYENSQGELHGVLGTDISLENIEKNIINTQIGEDGYAFLVDHNAKFIAHPKYREESFEKDSLKTATGVRRELLLDMADGKTGLRIVPIEGVDYYVAYAPLPVVGWSLGITVPIDEVILPAKNIRSTIEQYTNTAQNYIHQTLSDILMQFIILFAACTLILLLFSFMFSRTITRPIKDLVTSAQDIGNGNLDNVIEIKNNDEIGQLAHSFNTMASNLKNYIENLSIAITEKEHINSELNVAASIQNDMLPRIFPVFSSLEQVKVFAKMTPAKEVGGDFYDIFFIDENKSKLCCIVADVSGKGVPASLFMVITKTILKSTLSANGNILDAINQANTLLAEDNNTCMFVTVFASILDTNTGHFEYVNCGHNPPLLCRKDGSFEFMKLNTSLPLAVIEFAPYVKEETTLNEGDIIYMYTDGINEAMNKDGVIYSDERLIESLNNIKDKEAIDPEKIDMLIRENVASFVGEADQSDDMTTLILQYTSKS